jgi:hypothetical protein
MSSVAPGVHTPKPHDAKGSLRPSYALACRVKCRLPEIVRRAKPLDSMTMLPVRTMICASARCGAAATTTHTNPAPTIHRPIMPSSPVRADEVAIAGPSRASLAALVTGRRCGRRLLVQYG